MKTLRLKFLIACIGAIGLPLIHGSVYASSDVVIISVGERLQPIEKHFFDLHTPNPTEQASVTGTSTDTSSGNASQTTLPSTEINETDKQLLLTQEEADKFEVAQVAIQEKVMEKYKIQINSIMQRLGEKMNTLNDDQRRTILHNMRNKVASKKPAVIESVTIETERKEILLQMLDYIIERLNPDTFLVPGIAGE